MASMQTLRSPPHYFQNNQEISFLLEWASPVGDSWDGAKQIQSRRKSCRMQSRAPEIAVSIDGPVTMIFGAALRN
jgi:hypothetical protein